MKDINTRFAEAVEALKKAGRTKQFDEKVKGCTTIEAKLNAAEAVLKDAGIVRESASNLPTTMGEVVKQLSDDQYKVFSEQRRKNTNMSWEDQYKLAEAILKGEFKPPIKKNNGAADKFVEGNPFNQGDNFSTGYVKETIKSHLQKGDKVLFDGLLKLGKITEAEHSKMTGKKPEGYDKLTEQKRKDFDFAIAVGLSESDAFKLVEFTGTTFKEVSRR